MFKNYFTVAWRHLLKNRQFTGLNLVGLSTGLACTLLIWLWVQDERSVDRFHKNDDHLFQVMEHRPHSGGITTSPETPALLDETLTMLMPEVASATVTTPPSWFPHVVLSVGDENIKGAGLFAGKDYFKVFTYPLIGGNPNEALAHRDGIVISEQLAMRLFHDTDQVIGKQVSWQIFQIKKSSIVTGVFKGTPANASIQFDFLLSFEAFKEIMGMQGGMDSGGPFYTYVVLKEGTRVAAFNDKLSALMKDRSNGNQRRMFLKPYGENYLYGDYENGVQSGGRIAYVRLFSLIAIFILVMACINFMNLSTAKAAGRMKEMGIRKTIGAGRLSLMVQYLAESFLLVLAATLLALLMVLFFLPTFNHITGKELAIAVDTRFVVTLLCMVLITGCLAGSYPAFYLSGFHPVAVLKGKVNPGTGALWARKGLVIFQFTLSVVFIVAVWVVYRQIAFIQSHKTGYDKEQVICFDAEGKVPAGMDAFLTEIRQIPGVVNASSMVGNVLGGPSLGIPWQWNGVEETTPFRCFQASYGMIETLGIEMKEGRSFSAAYGMDTAAIIFNETAIRVMDIKDPVGKVIRFSGTDWRIIGVTKDFHFQSLHEAIKPLFFKLDFQNTTVMVKINTAREKEVINRLKAFYTTFNPGFPFDYKFLDEDYQAQYQAEQRVAVLSRYFAGLAVLISCLGLFGLASFTAEKKRKEIGIRKVLGATVSQVVLLLSKDFLRAVGIALGIAMPLAGWIMHDWLNGFARHISLGIDIFLVTGIAVILLTLLTVSFQAVHVAMANPAKSLDTA
ncbi:FtsX-like permease family protein [Pseudoflavitalea sp. X16]|uniref:ABC transporter permease n=1 Tax=Paraflavitalea devenefica TaxID=2716334 RepID=UPI0014240972|nr:ABC transporter permease [Paraflavitalea devenefica]NII25589.1 FtsX-like permease family protein [Paraflavitalea devenefica]